MQDISEERTYKHQVSADFVLEAITTLEWSDKQTKKFNEKGIYKQKLGALKKISKVLEQYFLTNIFDDTFFILISDVEIPSRFKFIIENIDLSIHNVIFLKTKLPEIEIYDSILAQKKGMSNLFWEQSYFSLKP